MVLILFNFIVFVYNLFSFFLEFEYGALAFFFNLFLLIVYVLISLSIIAFLCKKRQKRKICIQIVAFILVIFCSEINFKINIPEKIALVIKMPMIKKAVFEYESTGKMNDRIRLDDENCIAYEWDPGFLGSWSAVVYSPANNLDAAVSSYEAGNLNEFRAYKSLLGGSLIRITKIEDSFYLCNFN